MIWPRCALHGHCDVDDIGLERANRLIAQAELLHRPRREVIGNDVACRYQPLCKSAALLTLQIQRDAAFARVSIREISASVYAGHAVSVRSAAAQRGVTP